MSLPDTAPLDAHVERAVREFGDDLVLATSLSAEDLVVHHALDRAAAKYERHPRAFFLDTGRLHEVTYRLLDRARTSFATPIDVYFPDYVAVEALVRQQGAYGFRESIDARKACCGVRKLAPLERALAGKRAWLTGLRRDQSPTRAAVAPWEPDATHPGLTKINPLHDWSWDDVLAYLDAHGLPRSPLHTQGYVSIGCEPCTRAIEPGEDPRAGRWWWESAEHKECGLHRGAHV